MAFIAKWLLPLPLLYGKTMLASERTENYHPKDFINFGIVEKRNR
jgi:hypothetical protein